MTAKVKRCKQAGLCGFYSKHPLDLGKLAKGEEKDKNLARFHILQMRSSNARKNTISDKVQKQGNKLVKSLNWYSLEQGSKKFGAFKWEHWMESKLLPTRGDRVTGSREVKVEEHAVPSDWEEYSDEDWRSLVQRVDARRDE